MLALWERLNGKLIAHLAGTSSDQTNLHQIVLELRQKLKTTKIGAWTKTPEMRETETYVLIGLWVSISVILREATTVLLQLSALQQN
mmetsp:Transcript_37553/g.52947  ORF Transcript_37553/g.52947 Transcript_37553/m.52947 type:complete len:87 (+) Transcript_37553:225-485(+)